MKINRRASLALAFGTLLAGTTGAWAADVNLRIHTLVKSPHPYNDMADYLKATLEEKSEGRIAVKVFDSGQLGQDPAVIGEVGLGTIDMMVSTASNAAGEVPELSIFTMPYLFAGMDEALAILEPGTPAHDHFAAAFADRGTGVKLLALGPAGTRNMAAVDVSVTTPDQLDGLRMRTTQSPMDAATWSALGMLPVSVAWGELYAAMQTGVADAMESSLPGYSGSKLYEVAPNLALTQHQVQIHHISISQRTFDKMPEDLQQLVVDTAREANLHGLEKAEEYDGALVETLKKDHGVTVSQPDKAAFSTRLEPIQSELAAQLDLEAEYKLLKGK
ncbi:TRAP transporter substrate-binding protein [Oceaniglobus trochenteri]|uniref:TRAP transporter substrate-binding protein n=1 Tax=Oceaniglobus trochenteri TaxID=2763260 RepID=UPI001CFF5555|nr:TRAP transporter substrate-binding protein [Oceaniglobus trochenteri]